MSVPLRSGDCSRRSSFRSATTGRSRAGAPSGPGRRRFPAGLVILPLLLTPAASVRAQAGAPTVPRHLLARPGPATEVLLFGIFHFQETGADVYDPTHRLDIRSRQRQAEIEELVERLAAFRPTRIAVEAMPARQAALDSAYQAYREGRAELGVNEIQQVGFRLARRLGLAGVRAVDAQPADVFTSIFEQVEAREVELAEIDAAWQERYRRLYAWDDSLKTVHDLRTFLAYLNDPERIAAGHGAYGVGWFKLAGEDGFLGADFRASWYDRNLRIFRNLQRLAEPGPERILLLIGAGHLPILRFLVGTSPEFVLVEARDYLTEER
jgi:hypothetical protein